MISVIIPSYNREKTIVKSVKSVLQQTYEDIEVIVVDDGSVDDTKSVIKEIDDKRLKYVYQENSGACAARNLGIDLAKGDYIAFQDSDDEWLPSKLELQIEALQAKNADIVFCGIKKIYLSGKEQIIPDNEESGFCSQEKLLYESIASTQTIIGKAESIKNIKFDESMPRMQDYDFIIRASEKYKVYLLNEALVNVYEQLDSITASKKQYKKRLDITKQLLKKYETLSIKYPQWHVKMLKIIVHCQVMLRENADEALKEIYRLDKKKMNLAKIYLNKFGILYSLFKLKEYYQ